MLQWLARSPAVSERMAHAELQGSIKGYPLRVDFATAPTWSERILLVGESAGLVSPLTGEGIDFALESGRLAAEYCAGLLQGGDFSLAALAGYDALLRRHFQRLFVFLGYIRNLYINPALMNRTVQATHRFPEIKDLLVKILMSEEDAAGMVTPGIVRRVILGA
jgi:flavin-dependent dehydrogenase